MEDWRADIREAIQHLARITLQKNTTIQCKVVSVDKAAKTVKVLHEATDIEYPDIRLASLSGGDVSDGVFIYPKAESEVQVTFIDGTDSIGFVSKYGEIDGVEIVIENVEIQLTKDGIDCKIDSAELKLSKDEMSFKKGSMEIKAAAKILLKVGSKSVGSVLDTFFTKLATAQVLTPAGPGTFKPDTITDIQTAKTDLATILQA